MRYESDTQPSRPLLPPAQDHVELLVNDDGDKIGMRFYESFDRPTELRDVFYWRAVFSPTYDTSVNAAVIDDPDGKRLVWGAVQSASLLTRDEVPRAHVLLKSDIVRVVPDDNPVHIPRRWIRIHADGYTMGAVADAKALVDTLTSSQLQPGTRITVFAEYGPTNEVHGHRVQTLLDTEL